LLLNYELNQIVLFKVDCKSVSLAWTKLAFNRSAELERAGSFLSCDGERGANKARNKDQCP
jgi:hypothetical protein